jgi:hypothetical protein
MTSFHFYLWLSNIPWYMPYAFFYPFIGYLISFHSLVIVKRAAIVYWFILLWMHVQECMSGSCVCVCVCVCVCARYWGLNFILSHSPVLVLWKYFPGLASNRNPPNLCLLSS